MLPALRGRKGQTATLTTTASPAACELYWHGGIAVFDARLWSPPVGESGVAGDEQRRWDWKIVSYYDTSGEEVGSALRPRRGARRCPCSVSCRTRRPTSHAGDSRPSHWPSSAPGNSASPVRRFPGAPSMARNARGTGLPVPRPSTSTLTSPHRLCGEPPCDCHWRRRLRARRRTGAAGADGTAMALAAISWGVEHYVLGTALPNRDPLTPCGHEHCVATRSRPVGPP